ncbi:MAG: gas vesicle protein [Methanophagales archaeon]|nr:gas vesicle protein [Methanophagales archaeon]
MDPNRDTHATLVDLLDRILDKGLMLNADVIISVAGIPLIGINLKAALASVETMLKYGIWEDWDAAQRAIATEERRRKGVDKLPLQEGEEIILKMFGSHWYSKGIYRSWRPGHLYVTNKRVFLHRKEPAEMLFEATFEDIEGFAMERRKNIAKKETDYLYIFYKSGEIAKLHPTEAYPVKEAIEVRMKELGLSLEERTASMMDEDAAKFLVEDEEVVQKEKMWYLLEHPAPGGVTTKTWKSGKLYLTNKRVCWWYDFDECVAFEASLEGIRGVGIETRDFGGMLKMKRVLAIAYDKGEACFSGDEEAMQKMEEMLRSNVAEDEEMDACPSCGAKAPVQELLGNGCKVCGWVSARVKKMEVIV